MIKVKVREDHKINLLWRNSVLTKCGFDGPLLNPENGPFLLRPFATIAGFNQDSTAIQFQEKTVGL